MDNPEVVDQITEEYEKLSLQERELFHAMFADPEKFESKYAELESVVFKKRPPSAEEFLDPNSRWLDRAIAESVYPHIRSDFIAILNKEKAFSQVGMYGSTRQGKCEAEDTPILMSDLSVKMIQNIEVGDLVMGEDSKPRKVLALHKGHGDLYKVKQNKADDYIVNENHILTLQYTRWRNKYGEWDKRSGTTIDIPIQEYLKLSKTKKHKLKGIKAKLDFPEKLVEIDPYCLGFNLSQHKGISQEYLFNSREVRLKLLSGIIDSSGYLSKDKSGFWITQKSEKMTDSIVFLVRSLGFGVILKEDLGSVGFSGRYKIRIFGKTTEIPTKLKRKQATRDSRTNPLRTGIEVSYHGKGDYYGFQIDGTHRYLHADLTITHNTFLAILLIAYTFVFFHHLRDPNVYFGISPLKNLCIYIISFKYDKVYEVYLKPFYNLLESSPRFVQTKFQDSVKKEQRKLGNEYIVYSKAAIAGHITTSSGLQLITGNDDALAIIGADILQVYLSEIAFFIESAGAAEEDIFRLYSDAVERIRATVGSQYLAYAYLDTSANLADSLVETYLLKTLAKQPDVYFQSRARWEARPESFPIWLRTGETFPVITGDGNTSPKIVRDDRELEGVSKSLIIHVPIDVLSDFERNLLKSIKDIAGRPTVSESKLFQKTTIDEMWDPYLENVESIIIADAAQKPKGIIWDAMWPKYFAQYDKDAYMLKRCPKEPRWIGLDIAHCVDESTEVLTQRGWLKYDEVVKGDKTLGIDSNTHEGAWVDITGINIFPAKNREMLEIKGKRHSSLTTGNHRWYSRRRKKYGQIYKGYENVVVTSDKLSSRYSIPTQAVINNLPVTPTYSDAFVEIIAWFWTEGTIKKSRERPCNCVEIYQSEKVNSKHCQSIQKALETEYGNPVDSCTRNGRNFPTKPEWRTNVNKVEKRTWFLNSYIGKELLQVAPDRIVTPEFICSLTKDQLEIFIRKSFDGARSSEGTLGQKNKKMLQGLQMALILAGYGSGEHESIEHPNRTKMFFTTKPKKRSNYVKLIKKNMNKVTYSGKVWCPTTENGSWLAKKDGKIYYTGNSSKGDLYGICMLHKEHSVEKNEVLYVVDFCFTIGPGEHGINLDAVTCFIEDLASKGRVHIYKVLADTFQSESTLQAIKFQMDIDVEKKSVDREIDPYLKLYSLMLNKSIRSGKNIFLRNNLDSLYRTRTKQGVEKIDHSAGSTENKYTGDWEKSTCGINAKDAADGLCQTVFSAENTNHFPVAVYEEENSKMDRRRGIAVLDTGKTRVVGKLTPGDEALKEIYGDLHGIPKSRKPLSPMEAIKLASRRS